MEVQVEVLIAVLAEVRIQFRVEVLVVVLAEVRIQFQGGK